MSDYTEQTLTEAVIKRVSATPDPRLRQIMISLVKHLHGFVREVRPTWEELLAGIQFLTAVGQKCDDKRQEFILLSDSLGVSMLVDLLSHGKVGNATESDLLGRAWVEAAPELPLGSNLAKNPSDGEPCVITGSVASLDGTALAGAVVDFWEADGDGFYDLQKADGLNLRARLRTDASASFGSEGAAGELWDTNRRAGGRHAAGYQATQHALRALAFHDPRPGARASGDAVVPHRRPIPRFGCGVRGERIVGGRL